MFTIRAVVNGKTYSDGVGRNKKEAKQNAAKNALSLLEKTEPANSETNYCSSDSFPKLTQANYTCWLNEYAQKNRSIFKPIETTRMGSNTQFCLYACKYVCDDKEFPEAVCKGRKDAKEAAAKKVYEELLKESKIVVPDENRNVAQNSNMPPLSSPLSSQKQTVSNTESATVSKDFIGMLNHYCQKTNQVLGIKLVEKRGPAHNPEFVYKVVINKTEYSEGQGKTAKEAKQNAAQLALSVLREQSDWNSQSSFMSSVSEDETPSQISVNESKDDEGSLKAKSQSTSDSVVFKNSSVPMTKTNSPAPKPSPSDIKPKIKLAANFQVSPNRNEEETPSMNDHSLTQPSKKGTTASNSSAKSRFLEDFELISPIGTGGFGCVFKARKKLEKKYYAVKIVKRTGKSVREVEALADLAHPNIVRYYTSWTEETAYRSESSESFSISNSSSGSASEYLYIQMEFCEGKTLHVWIDGRNSHPEKQLERRQDALQIMKQVLEAVKYIHSKHIIHRDLKPANIMFGNEGAVKVGDFGLATAAEGDNDEGLLERTKRTGTRSYMSPEQRSQCSYDKKVDIFALGLIYFELLWNLGTKFEKQKIWDDIRSKKLPKGFSEKFEFEHKLIKQMLCDKPEDRPDSSELLTKLDWSSAVIQQDHNGNRENRTY
ncbi:interferon-induced, double-stranded RNA-activated protein kinase isoform X2 [Colossoma macropomum]|uniref:interferon-induced, double-stranded RNA-activated protein kinase isoform X2 n=1 Tax=Colossoma macropomum TaxID=42526 RepID=UPI0018641130|nr:interferon-induced, double-stranded RNA-activated protein kinase isoform X2 [Colossoma macropomum]